MPEIRLGSTENLPNIQLGSVQIEEVRLGNILVWQNNQGPIYVSLTWDGTAFNAPVPFEEFSFNATSQAATFAAPRIINIRIAGLSDPDNVMNPMPTDFIVGYRLRRPDGTWAAGDPSSMAANTIGAPTSDYGDPLPGFGGTYNPVDDEFTAGTLAGTTNIQVQLRDTDAAGVIVNLPTQDFVDEGEWELFVIDARGGESSMGTINVTLNYVAPNAIITGQGRNPANTANMGGAITFTGTQAIQNATIGGPTTVTLTPTLFGGGPLNTVVADQHEWTCVSGCTGGPFTNRTINVPIPQAAAGDATPAVWEVVVTGRASRNNVAGTDTERVMFRSGPSLTAPTFTYTGAGNCNPGAAINGNWTAVTSNTLGTFVSFNPRGTGTWSGTCPACDANANLRGGTVVPVTETRTLAGVDITTPAATPQAAVRGRRPPFPTTCTVTINCNNVPTARDARCGTTVAGNAINCNSTSCAGTAGTTPCDAVTLTIANNDDDNYRGGGATNSAQCSGPAGTATMTVNYTAIAPTFQLVCPGALPAFTDAAAAGCMIVQTNNVDISNGPAPFINNIVGQCGPPGTATSFIASCGGALRSAVNGRGLGGVNCAGRSNNIMCI